MHVHLQATLHDAQENPRLWRAISMTHAVSQTFDMGNPWQQQQLMQWRWRSHLDASLMLLTGRAICRR